MSAPRTMATLCVVVGATSLALLLSACGATATHELALPALEGESRAELGLLPTADGLARRAAMERSRGALTLAERYARWSLTVNPEHPGGLVEAARVAVARAAKVGVAKRLGPLEVPGRVAAQKLRAVQRELETARRLYGLMARLDGFEGRSRDAVEVAEERALVQVQLAEVELALGRVEQAAALLAEMDADMPPIERGRRAELHGALAETWLGRGLGSIGREHAEAAARLGASGDVTRARTAMADLLALPAGVVSTQQEEVRRRAEAALGRDAKAWRQIANWQLSAGRPADARWAAARLVELEREPRSVGLLAVAAARAGDGSGAEATCRAEAKRAQDEGAAVLWACAAAMFEDEASTVAGPEAETLAREVIAVAPATPLALSAAVALVERAGTERDKRLVELSPTLVAALAAAPERWLEVARLAVRSGDDTLVAQAAAFGRKRGDRAAAVAELRARLMPGRPPSAQGQSGEAEMAALEVAIGKGDFAGLTAVDSDELERTFEVVRVVVGSQQPGLIAALEQRLVGMPALPLMKAALQARGGQVASATRLLEDGSDGQSGIVALEKTDGFAAARVRAAWELDWQRDGGSAQRASANLWRAAELAPAPRRGATLSVAVERLYRQVIASRLEARRFEGLAMLWLDAASQDEATPGELGLAEAVLGVTGLSARLRHDALAFLQDAGLRLNDAERATLVTRIAGPGGVDGLEPFEVTDLLEDAAIAKARGTRDPLKQLEAAAEEARQQQRPDLAANLYSRLSPYDVRRLEAAVELVRLFASRGEPERARRYARTLLERSADPKLVAPGRMLALADALTELGEWALARQAFARTVELGERSSRALLGLVRAHLQAGDEAAADQVANQWLDARPRRDQRAHDELAKVFANEGRLGRAIEVLRARLGPSDTMDPGLFSGLVDLLLRSGRAVEVEPLAQDFVKADVRGTMRAHGVAAQKLMDAGRPGAALALLENALSQRPRDSSLLSAALMGAMHLRDPAAEDFGKRLVGEAPTSWDVWVRVLEDLRGAGLSVQALNLATHGLARASGEPRLLVARGRVSLLSGEGDRALADFAEALARADEPRAVATQVENELSRVFLDERLAVMTGRALALVPGRADLTLTHGNALLAAGRADEAERLFAGFTAETDRGQSVIAATWHRHGFMGRALDHWTRGFGELNAKEAGEAFVSVASSLVDGAQPERLDVFARLYVQALRGAEAPSLLPLALAYRDTGSHEKYLEWLGRADLESPSAETARALLLAHLDLLHQSNQSAAAQVSVLMHGERMVTRAVNAIPAGRPPLPILGQQLEFLTQTLLARGESELLRRLVSRIEKRLGVSLHTRLSAARAALHAGDLSSALSVVSGRFEAWRSQRDLLPALGRLLDDLVAAGHANAAMGLMERALAAGNERDLQAASLRIFARAGHPELAAAAAQRLATEMPALNTWIAADALATEGMPQVAAPFARWALASGVSPAARDRMVRLLASRGAGAAEARLTRALDATPRFAGDLQERAASGGTVAKSLGNPTMDLLAYKYLVAALEIGPLDAMTVRAALSNAALLDSRGELERQLGALGTSPERPAAGVPLPGSHIDAVLALISRQSPQRVRQLGDAAVHLSSSGLMAPALRAWQALHDLQPGHLPTTLEAARTALAAGLPAQVLRLTERGLGGVESPPRLARLELAALAASHHELALADELVSPVELEPETKRTGQRGLTDKAARVAAMSADYRDDQPAWEEATRRLLASAPDESVVRLAAARWLLDTSRPGDRGPTERARALLEPVVASGTAPLAALASMLVVTLRLPGEGLEAQAVLAELDRRFPGPLAPELEASIVDALLVTSDPARASLWSRLLGSAPQTTQQAGAAHLSPERRLERLATAIEARQLARLAGLGSPTDRAFLDASTLALLDAELTRVAAPGWSAGHTRLAIAIGHERDQSSPGSRSEALAVAVAAYGQTRTSVDMLGLYTTTIARVFATRPAWLDGRGLEDAKAALAPALAFGARAGLYEGEARLLTPPVAWDHRMAETQLLLAEGDGTNAAAAFRRLRMDLPRVEKRLPTTPPPFHDELAPAPTDFLQSPQAGPWLALGLQLVAANALNPREARGLLGACVSARMAPWSGLCREQLSR